MDFTKELAKELGLMVIAKNTMLGDYVKACEEIAVRYHEIEVKKFPLGAVSGRSELLLDFVSSMYKIKPKWSCSEMLDHINDYEKSRNSR